MLPIVGKDWTMEGRHVSVLGSDAFASALFDLELDLTCRRCGGPVRGANGLGDKEWTLECKCRTLRYRTRRG